MVMLLVTMVGAPGSYVENRPATARNTTVGPTLCGRSEYAEGLHRYIILGVIYAHEIKTVNNHLVAGAFTQQRLSETITVCGVHQLHGT